MAELDKMVLVVDLDKTLCTKKTSTETYADVKPIKNLIEVINAISDLGGTIIIESARNMLTQHNDESKVIKNIGLTTLEWLENNNIKYDGIKFGKTMGSCYIDDKALRPKEFLSIYNSLDDKSNLEELDEKIKKYLEEN